MSSTSVDKQWAKKYILDPLTAPEPSQECGPGSSFASRPSRLDFADKLEESKKRKGKASVYPSPPASSSPKRSTFRRLSDSFSNPFRSPPPASQVPDRGSSSIGDSSNQTRPVAGRSNSSSLLPGSSREYPQAPGVGRSQSVRQPPSAHRNPGSYHNRTTSGNLDQLKFPRRSNSLSQRYPGDMSHRPLDIIKRDARAADRAPHLRKSGMPGTDIIDNLDTIGGTYHHGGPFDATLAARNSNKMYAPIEAVKDSNMEAIRATPRNYVQDSLQRHVPLQGTSVLPPGGVDPSGNVMSYEEGADLMRERDAPGGAYKRWDGIQYHADDLKGKGEPSYTIERDHKENKARMRSQAAEGGTGPTLIEMQPRQSPTSGISTSRKDLGSQVRQRSISSAADAGRPREGPSSPRNNPFDDSAAINTETNSGMHRSNTTGNRLKDGLKRRFGSLRRKKQTADDDYY